MKATPLFLEKGIKNDFFKQLDFVESSVEQIMER